MGHRSFGNKASAKESSSKGDSCKNPVGSKNETMNGLQKITEEQTSTVTELRRNVHDRASAKMGDLLLRGYTMLNAYCDVCSGILMEDRQGVRVCVTCDLLNAELNLTSNTGSRIVAEIPLDASDEILEDIAFSSARANQKTECAGSGSSISISNATMKNSKEESLKKLYEIGSEKCEQKQSLEDGPCTTNTIDADKSKLRLTKLASMRPGEVSGVESALAAVDEKLKWCSEKLAVTEDLNEILLLHKAIRSGIGIIELYSGGK